MKRLAVVLGVALLALGVLLLHLMRESRHERELAVELEGRLATAEAGQAARQGTAQGSGADGTGLLADPSAAESAAGNGTPAAGASNPIAAARAQMMDTPEGREFTRTMLRMSMEQQYPDVGRELGLSDEDVEKLFDLLAERSMGIVNAQDESAGAAREERGRQLAQTEQSYEGELAALLGDRYPRWQEYERTASERQRQAWERQSQLQLRNAVSTRSDPVTDAQFQALHAALQAEQRRIDQESAVQDMGQQTQRLDGDQERLIAVAAAHLSPGQLDRYRRHLRQQAEMMRMMAGMEASGGAGMAIPVESGE